MRGGEEEIGWPDQRGTSTRYQVNAEMQRRNDAAANEDPGSLRRDAGKVAQADLRGDEIDGGLQDVRPADQGEHDGQAGPNVVEGGDEGAEGEVDEGDQVDAGNAPFAQADEEIDPGAGLSDVRQADHQEGDGGEEFGGFWHGEASEKEEKRRGGEEESVSR